MNGTSSVTRIESTQLELEQTEPLLQGFGSHRERQGGVVQGQDHRDEEDTRLLQRPSP